MNERRWFRVLLWGNTVCNPYVADIDDLKGFNRDDFEMGRPIENWDQGAWISASRLEDDGDLDDVLQTHLALPIFSDRLHRALDVSGISGIQYLPIQAIRPNGVRIEGFSIANILNIVAALDLEKSDYDIFPNDYFLPQRRGRISGLRNVALRESEVEGYDIIRLSEYDVTICVSAKFRATFEKGGFTGYSFAETVLVKAK